MQVSKLSHNSSGYPDMLREIHKPPQELYVRGTLPKGTYVAIVGTRKPSEYGKRITYRLAYDLARAGIVIVSGLALGLDGEAHKGALEAGGQTVAVLGTAINRLYPMINRKLGESILDGHGAVISEYAPDTPWHIGMFPERNRIIAGLSHAVIITEAADKSGTLITAKAARDQGRQVFAVPGIIGNPRSVGPHELIKEGASLVTAATDVINALDIGGVLQQPVRLHDPQESQLIELMQAGHTNSQDLIEHSGLSAAQFANLMSLMEITGKVRNLGAGQWVSR